MLVVETIFRCVFGAVLQYNRDNFFFASSKNDFFSY